MTPIQLALLELSDHCGKCPTCKPQWRGALSVRRHCPVAHGLYLQWHRTWRAKGATR
jgi:hypothetical protein